MSISLSRSEGTKGLVGKGQTLEDIMTQYKNTINAMN
jgi:hypothetical protein